MDELNPAAPQNPERWQQLLGELSHLFSESVHRAARFEELERERVYALARNEELEKRASDLERNVQVWRQAHKDEMAAKESLMATMTDKKAVQDGASITVCLIDGNSTVFASTHLLQGKSGGEAAARALHRLIAPPGTQSATGTVCATVFCHRARLRDTLVRSGTCSGSQFDMFWIGFVQAAPMFYMVDVGPGKEVTEAKMCNALRVYARMPQVSRIFFGGAHDGGYRPPLAALALEDRLDKVVLVQVHDEVARDLQSMKIEVVKWQGIFIPHRLSLPPMTPSTGHNIQIPPTPSITGSNPGPANKASKQRGPNTPGGKQVGKNANRNPARTVPLPTVPLPK